MYVTLTEDGVASLEEPTDFTRFHVELPSGSAHSDDVLRRAGVGWARDDDQAFIAADAVVALGPAGDPEWTASLAAMVESARKHGWWDEPTRSIAAHVVRTS